MGRAAPARSCQLTERSIKKFVGCFPNTLRGSHVSLISSPPNYKTIHEKGSVSRACWGHFLTVTCKFLRIQFASIIKDTAVLSLWQVQIKEEDDKCSQKEIKIKNIESNPTLSMARQEYLHICNRCLPNKTLSSYNDLLLLKLRKRTKRKELASTPRSTYFLAILAMFRKAPLSRRKSLGAEAVPTLAQRGKRARGRSRPIAGHPLFIRTGSEVYMSLGPCLDHVDSLLRLGHMATD